VNGCRDIGDIKSQSAHEKLLADCHAALMG